QIRHYAVADAGVSLRLMRALGDIASTVADPKIRKTWSRDDASCSQVARARSRKAIWSGCAAARLQVDSANFERQSHERKRQTHAMEVTGQRVPMEKNGFVRLEHEFGCLSERALASNAS